MAWRGWIERERKIDRAKAKEKEDLRGNQETESLTGL